MNQQAGGEIEPAGDGNRRMLLRAGVVAAAVLVGVIAWVASQGGDDGDSAPAEPQSQIVSEAELVETAAEADQPIYWAGEIDGMELELSEVAGGGYQVRYLPEGEETEPAEAAAEFLTIGSYPLPDPAKALDGFAKRSGSSSRAGKGGREVVTSEERPTSVYFVDPDNTVQVEVYDPSPQRAMALALSRQVEPAG